MRLNDSTSTDAARPSARASALRASSLENWQALERVVEQALDVPVDQRRARLAVLCSTDASLYEAALVWLDACEQEDSLLDTPIAGVGALAAIRESFDNDTAPDDDATTSGDFSCDRTTGLTIGAHVGAWRLLEEIGRGGMGTVFLAERTDAELSMRAAIKFMHRALALDAVGVRRFRDERRILAALEHPGIARLLDGGVDHGLSWFAMEYVQGAPIDTWCDDRALSVAARIALFCRVCETVHHAHARLVVHRDLKPANILVTEGGNPKLLDFGIAKLLADAEQGSGSLTHPGMQPMTLSYAAPEQLRGDAPSTTTDIYSLGVLLHVLLSGQLPRDGIRLSAAASTEEQAADQELVARVARVRGTTPTRLERQLRGDLDTIVARALHPDHQRRYATADALAADLQRHLEGQPVLARPDTASYRLRKFVARHPIGTAAGLAGAALVVAFSTVTFVQAQRLRVQASELRSQAATLTTERDKATEVTRFLTGILSSADPYKSGGHVPTLREVLDRGAASAAIGLRDRPETRAQLLSAMAPAYFGLGDWDRAGELAEQAVTLRRSYLGPSHPELAASLIYLAQVRLNQNRAGEAEAQTREALAIYERAGNTAHNDFASALSTLGVVLQHQGRLREAEQVLRQLLASERRRVPYDASRVAQVARNLGHVLRDGHAYAAALPLYQEAYDVHRSLYGPEHPETANSAVNLGFAYSLVDNAFAAESLLRLGVATKRRLLGIQHPDVAGDQLTLSRVLAREGKTAEAERLRREAIAVLQPRQR